MNSNMFTRALLLLCLCITLHASATAQQRWWGYYDGTEATKTMGTQTAETYNACIQLTSTRTVLNGSSIHGVRFNLRDKTNVSEVKVWLSKNRPTSADAADIQVVNVPQEQLKDNDHDAQMLEVTLPQSYAMQGTVYVGYSFKLSKASSDADKNPIVCTTAGKGNGTFWLRSSKVLTSWNDMSTRNYGALALQVLVSNPSLPAQGAYIPGIDRMVAVTNGKATAEVTLTSDGLSEVNDVDYSVTIGGQQQPARHAVLSSPIYAAGQTSTLPIEFDMPASNGATTYSVNITKVNGAANNSRQPAPTSTLIAVDQLGKRRSVVEEFTGTWCTNCPRGIVGMENLARRFGDDFIGIAVHTNNGSTQDPMYLSAYSPLIPTNVPSCQMDRLLQCDPYLGTDLSDYHFHADKDFELMLARPAEADIQLQATWKDDTQTQLQLTATTTFYFNSTDARYALAFVLTEDELSGTSKEWYQVNGESGKTTFPDADMERFRNGPDPVTDISYNHVAVAASGVTEGIGSSITLPLTSSQQQHFTTTLDLTANTIIQDKSKLEAIVMLLDTATGQIINAAKTAIGTGSGIRGLSMEATADDRWYTLDGRLLPAAPKAAGIYLKGNKKIIVKQTIQ